jgi:hypothetical protein
MHKTRNTLLSLGTAIATTKLAHLISKLALDDVLRPVGLSRRHASWPGNLVFLGAGILLGGATALLLAPTSGEQTRARLAKKAGELGDAAVNRAREVGQELRDEVGALRERRGNGEAHEAPRPV